MRTGTSVCPYCTENFTWTVERGLPPAYCSRLHASQAATERRTDKVAGLATRWCAYGKHDMPTTDFSSPTAPYCREHMATYARERRKINGGIDPQHTRMINLRRYALTPESFAAMLAAQDGRCKICKTGDPGPSGWQLDHDHACCNTRKRSCGRCNRGILCTRCNIGIGNLQDDPVIIQAALDYLLNYRARLAAADLVATSADLIDQVSDGLPIVARELS